MNWEEYGPCRVCGAGEGDCCIQVMMGIPIPLSHGGRFLDSAHIQRRKKQREGRHAPEDAQPQRG